MGSEHLEAERTETGLALELLANRNGGVTGLTVLVAIRDAATLNSWLDFADNTFKTVGWTTRQAALTEVSAANAPGQYRRLLDLSAITTLPASPARLIAEYDVSGSLTAQAFDTIVLKEHVFDVAISADILSDATPFQGADVPAILADTAAIEPLVVANLDATVSSRESTTDAATRETNILAAIAGISSISIADVQTALTNQGYTVARAAFLDNLDATISSVVTAIGALNNLSQAGVQAAMTAQGYTSVRAVLLDNLDAAVSTRSSHSAADVDTVLTAAHGAGSWAAATGFATPADVTAAETNILAAIAAIPAGLTIADIQTALTNQGYTTARAAEISEILDHLKNRLEWDFGPTPAELVLYDRTGTVELHRWPMTTDGVEKVITQFGVQTRRGVPV